MYKVLQYVGVAFAMVSFVIAPGLIEGGQFLGGIALFIVSFLIGLISVVYLYDPNDSEQS